MKDDRGIIKVILKIIYIVIIKDRIKMYYDVKNNFKINNYDGETGEREN